jgi:hypothetical protein
MCCCCHMSPPQYIFLTVRFWASKNLATLYKCSIWCSGCITQPDGTLFFLIFTYLRGRSQWKSRDYGSNVAICHFLKPETKKGDFRLYFVFFEKSCRGRHHSEILKTNTKTLIYSIWIRPQGSLGCQKVRQGPLKTLFEVWRANIAPKMMKIRNTQGKQGFSLHFFQLWWFFEVCAFWGQY